MMEMFTAHLEIRSKSPKGSWPKQGPDCYVAVQLVPEGVKPLKCLCRKNAMRRRIKIVYCGNAYRQNAGPKSMYSKALNKAHEIVNTVNKLNELINENQ